MRGLVDRKGELFAYLRGASLFTIDGEETGRIEGNFIVDLAGKKIWRVVGDAVYTLKENEPVGFFGAERPDEYD